MGGSLSATWFLMEVRRLRRLPVLDRARRSRARQLVGRQADLRGPLSGAPPRFSGQRPAMIGRFLAPDGCRGPGRDDFPARRYRRAHPAAGMPSSARPAMGRQPDRTKSPDASVEAADRSPYTQTWNWACPVQVSGAARRLIVGDWRGRPARLSKSLFFAEMTETWLKPAGPASRDGLPGSRSSFRNRQPSNRGARPASVAGTDRGDRWWGLMVGFDCRDRWQA